MNKTEYSLRFRRFQQSREKFFAPKINAELYKQYEVVARAAPGLGLSAIQLIDSAGIARVIRHLYMDAGIVYGAKIRADFAKMGAYKQNSSNSVKSYKFNPYHVGSGEHGGEFTTGPEPTKEEIALAVATYQSTLFDAINNELRYDKPDKYKDVIKLLDKASTDTTSDTLYRGLNSNFAKTLAQKHNITDLNNLDELKSKLIGKTIHDKAFMSTSRNLQSATDFARDMGTGKPTVMQISGTKKGIEVKKYVDTYRAKLEQEFIIKRGSTVKITNVSISKTGKLILYTALHNQQKELKARGAMGFSQHMARLIADYFSVDVLNVSEGITQTTRDLITKVFNDAYAIGLSINEIVEKLKDTELSKIRARLIARTETVTATNQSGLFVAKDTGLLLNKTWLATKDKRTRDDHREVDGHQVGMDEYFHVGDATMLVPGARTQENGLPVPASEVCNCRCTHTYQAVRDSSGRLIRA